MNLRGNFFPPFTTPWILLSLPIFQDAGDPSATTRTISVVVAQLLSSPRACLRARKYLQRQQEAEGSMSFPFKGREGRWGTGSYTSLWS